MVTMAIAIITTAAKATTAEGCGKGIQFSPLPLVKHGDVMCLDTESDRASTTRVPVLTVWL